MPRPIRTALIAAAVPIILFAWVGVVFVMDRAGDAGEILGKVTIGGVELGGLTATEAGRAIVGVETQLGNEPITVTVADTQFTLLPYDVGFDIDEQAVIDDALTIGRKGGVPRQMSWWLGHLTGGSPGELPLPATYNRASLVTILHSWETQAIGDPPTEGGIDVEGGQIVAIYPTSGTGLDFEATADLIGNSILGDRQPVTAITEFRVPTLTKTDVDRAVTRARTLVNQPVTLAKILPETSVTFPPEVLASSIKSRIIGTADDPHIDLFFQIGPLEQFLNPIRATVEKDPVDAQVVIRPDDVPLVLPGTNGVVVDDGSLPDSVWAAANSVTRTAPLPVRDGNPPSFTTEDAEALGIKNLLYTATTYYACCGDEKNLNRINNIHRIADQVNGAIVLAGDTFDLNAHVGRRTEENGYKRAGAIIGPIVYCCDDAANVGGGTSQFTTTLYNAMYWSGLEDVRHHPHTLWFSKYPMVREATLGFPEPNLVFRNDTTAAIYIKTEYTNDSITVKFFGDNGGITVTSETSPQQGFTEPGEYLLPDDTLHPGDKELVDEGKPGFTASVTRTITYPDGRTKVQTWWWTYDAFPVTYGVHPCELPPDHRDYDEAIKCPVEVPSLGNMTFDEAKSALQAVGLNILKGADYEMNDTPENQTYKDTVRAQNPRPGEWVDPDTVITVRIGVIVTPP
ncbi:MAG TPA: VanW family protein [Acidimicrobiia bacterium]|nr:VanW family protein [Acidimicrobiia bacterium]